MQRCPLSAAGKLGAVSLTVRCADEGIVNGPDNTLILSHWQFDSLTAGQHGHEDVTPRYKWK